MGKNKKKLKGSQKVQPAVLPRTEEKKVVRQLIKGEKYTIAEVFEAMREYHPYVSSPYTLNLNGSSIINSFLDVTTEVNLSLKKCELLKFDLIEIEVVQYSLKTAMRMDFKKRLVWTPGASLTDSRIKMIDKIIHNAVVHPISERLVLTDIIDLPF